MVDYINIAYSPIALGLATFSFVIIVPFGMALRFIVIRLIRVTQKALRGMVSYKIT